METMRTQQPLDVPFSTAASAARHWLLPKLTAKSCTPEVGAVEGCVASGAVQPGVAVVVVREVVSAHVLGIQRLAIC